MDTLSFKIPDFEGPLDLLLHLVQKHKIDLSDIPIAEITEQYMAYLREMAEMNMEITVEFLAMASHLLYIKSRALLPVPQDMEEEDPKEELAQRIRLYKEAKEAAQKLEKMQFCTFDNYFKAPEALGKAPIENESMPVERLLEAFLEIQKRLEESAPPPVSAFREIVQVPQVSLGEQIQYVKRLFRSTKRRKFRDLFRDMHHKNEVIATFLAVLHLVNRGRIRIEEHDEEIFLIGGEKE